MSWLRRGYVTGPIIGALWVFVIATTVSVVMSFATGGVFRPVLLASGVVGAGLGLIAVVLRRTLPVCALVGVVLAAATYAGLGPMWVGEGVARSARLLGSLLFAAAVVSSLWKILEDLSLIHI